MKTMYINRSCNIVINDDNTCDQLDSSRIAINSLYIAKEPMHVVFGDNGDNEEVDVDKNDIIITFYAREYKTKMIVVKNEDWVNNIVDYESEIQEEKERWALSKGDTNCETDQ